MPRLISTENPQTAFAMLVLRRSLWQLAILGVASAIAIGALADAPGVLPVWLLLVPACALCVHHRGAVLALVRAVATDRRRPIGPRRRPASRPANRRSETVSRRRVPRPALPVKQAR